MYTLFKALYGLCQAPHAWYAQLNKCLEKLGFIKCPFEHAVYTRREGNECLIVGVYVNDLLNTRTRISNIEKFKKHMSSELKMSDMGRLSYYLKIEVNRGRGYTELKQASYARRVLERAVKYPMESKIQLNKDEGGKSVNPTQFKSLIGGLLLQ